jgi:transcriptional regulator with XRE-family HTH domain
VAFRNQPPESLPAGARDHPEVIAACRDRDIGRLFRLVNNLTDGPHQFTAAHLARRCGISPSRVGEYMDGKHHAKSVDVVIRVADGLRIPGARFGLGPRPWEHLRDHSAPVVLAAESSLSALAVAHSGSPLGVAAGFVPEAPAGFAPFMGKQQPLTDADVPVISAMLSALTATDHQFGGGYARRAATAFLTDVIEPRLSAQGPQSVRLDLLRAASEFGIRVAWMHLDTADDAAARRSANLAFQWAQESGDLSCAGWVMSMCALLETWIGEPRRALAYARAAVGLTQDSPPLVRAFAYGKLARAHALAGERTETDRVLGQARDAFDVAAGTDVSLVPVTVRDSYGLAYLLDEEAHCYRDIGDGRRTLERSEQSLELRGRDRFARNRAFAMSNQALAYVQLGEIEQACATADSLLALSASLTSRRVESRVTAVLGALARHCDVPAAAELHERRAQMPMAPSRSSLGGH